MVSVIESRLVEYSTAILSIQSLSLILKVLLVHKGDKKCLPLKNTRTEQ